MPKNLLFSIICLFVLPFFSISTKSKALPHITVLLLHGTILVFCQLKWTEVLERYPLKKGLKLKRVVRRCAANKLNLKVVKND
jgi:hypothetical protein